METQLTKNRFRSVYAFGAAIVVSASIALTGCGAASSSTGGGPSGAQSSSAGGTTTGGTSTTGSTSLDGFPTDKVPMIQGEVIRAQHPGNTYGVWIKSDDLVGDLAKATKLLTDAGYENVIATASYADFHGSEYQVHVVAKVDPKYGKSILYSFYHVK